MKITKSEQNFIVEIDEEVWFGKDIFAREILLDEWREQAAAQNCTSLVVFVNPDPILPVYGIARKTRVHGEKLASESVYEISLTYSAELALKAWCDMGQEKQNDTVREIREQLAVRGRRHPGRYEIFYTDVNGTRIYITRGRV